MCFANLAVWTPGRIVEIGAVFGIIALILFGITLTFVSAFYFVRVAGGYFSSRRAGVLQERAAGASQAGNLALLALGCGPVLAIFIGLITLPATVRLPGFRLLDSIAAFFTIAGVGTVAGMIAGGAFWVCSSLLGRVRKTLKKRARGRAWDPDFDGLS
jgi:hypothetical protein